MPPYPPKGEPPKPTLLVTVPVCLWCRKNTAHKCSVCGLLACYNCTRFAEDNRCVHVEYKPVEATGWELP